MFDQDNELHDDNAPVRCLDFRPGTSSCYGIVGYHWNGDPAGKTWPRCEQHQRAREEARENSVEKYANSDVAPSWFDPADAGERWDDDY